MDNLSELKAIWLNAKTDCLPDISELLKSIRRYRRKLLIKKVAIVVAAIVLVSLMFVVVFLYRSSMLSTRIGEAFIIISGMMLLYTNTNSIKRVYQFKNGSNLEYLWFLEKTRSNQIYFYKITQVIALSFNSVGLLLYIYEFVQQNRFLLIASYLIFVIYLAILWFVIRTKAYKKQADQLNDKIKKLKSLIENLNQEI